MVSEKKKVSNARWDKANSKSYGFKCFFKTDQDIIDHLDRQENRNAYIKNLIRQDMARQDMANNPD